MLTRTTDSGFWRSISERVPRKRVCRQPIHVGKQRPWVG